MKQKSKIIICPACKVEIVKETLLRNKSFKDYEMVTKVECPSCKTILEIPLIDVSIEAKGELSYSPTSGKSLPASKFEVRKETPGTLRVESILESRKMQAKFGRYEILEEIGRGGMGIVYKALDTNLKRIVDLKILRYESSSERDIKRFLNEAESAARLNHANIVPIYEVGEELGIHYFTMEYIEGTTLERMISERKTLKEKDALSLLEKIARAVDYAHKHGIIHRDLKPSNILITVNNIPKLSDFGLTKTLDIELKLTYADEIIGTPYCMAPEQITGRREKIDLGGRC